jgi:hypothetical protein
MMPVLLDVVRLLAWPMDLAPDYSPMTVLIRRSWGGVAIAGGVLGTATVLLGLVSGRRWPAVAFGILLAAGSYAPTSNLFFASGVVLAERALYLAALAPALCLGWALVAVGERPYRRLAGGAAVLLLTVFAARTVDRIPFWGRHALTVVEGVAEHPENYRARIHLGGLTAASRDSARALAEYLAAAALGENDPFIAQFTVPLALGLKRPDLAVAEGRRVHRMASHDPRTGRWLSEAYVGAGRLDSAIALGLRDAVRYPGSPGFVHTYQWALGRANAPRWRVLAADLSANWLAGRLVSAAARIDSLHAYLHDAAGDPDFCGSMIIALPAVRALNPGMLSDARQLSRMTGQMCPPLEGGQIPPGLAN